MKFLVRENARNITDEINFFAIDFAFYSLPGDATILIYIRNQHIIRLNLKIK